MPIVVISSKSLVKTLKAFVHVLPSARCTILMHQDLSATTISHGSDETEEPVLVEAQEFSEDEENFADEDDEENHSDFDYDENGEEEEEEEEEDIEFEDDDDDDDMLSKGLHDINTLRHLYRFGLLQTEQSNFSHFTITF
jgi:hypothetical protein